MSRLPTSACALMAGMIAADGALLGSLPVAAVSLYFVALAVWLAHRLPAGINPPEPCWSRKSNPARPTRSLALGSGALAGVPRWVRRTEETS